MKSNNIKSPIALCSRIDMLFKVINNIKLLIIVINCNGKLIIINKSCL